MIIARASEKTEKARQEVYARIQELKAIRPKTDEQRAELTRAEVQAAILHENARREIFEAAAPVIVEVLKKYNGKQYGEKTAEKIKAEIKERAGVNFWISRPYYSRDAQFCPIGADGWNVSGWYNEFILYNAAARSGFLDHNTNRITAPEAIILSGCNEIEPEPEKKAAELIEMHAEILRKYDELRGLVSEFNGKKPNSIKYLELSGVRAWII